MSEIVRCPKCDSTKFVLPVKTTSLLTIDTEDMGYREFDDENGECTLIGGDFVCAECEFIVEKYTLIYAKLKEIFDCIL